LFNRDTSEVIENRLAVNSDYEFVGSLPRSRTSQEIPSSAQAKPLSSDVATTALSKSHHIDRGKFILPLENKSPEEYLYDVVDAMVISNIQAVSAPCKVNGEVKETASDEERKVHSEITKRKEQGKQDIGPATETVPEQKASTLQPEKKVEADQQQQQQQQQQQAKLKVIRMFADILECKYEF
jgi:hypothetical protein